MVVGPAVSAGIDSSTSWLLVVLSFRAYAAELRKLAVIGHCSVILGLFVFRSGKTGNLSGSSLSEHFGNIDLDLFFTRSLELQNLDLSSLVSCPTSSGAGITSVDATEVLARHPVWRTPSVRLKRARSHTPSSIQPPSGTVVGSRRFSDGDGRRSVVLTLWLAHVTRSWYGVVTPVNLLVPFVFSARQPTFCKAGLSTPAGRETSPEHDCQTSYDERFCSDCGREVSCDRVCSMMSGTDSEIDERRRIHRSQIEATRSG